MTLDLNQVIGQIEAMGAEQTGRHSGREESLAEAEATLQEFSSKYQEVADRAAEGKPAWPVAQPKEPLDARRSPGEVASDFIVLASDGSQIEPSRHEGVLCCLLNIGLATLRYGDNPGAVLTSEPLLLYREQDVYLISGHQRALLEGHLLAARRTLAETQALARKAIEQPKEVPSVALRDGPLTLQTLEGRGVEARLRQDLLTDFLAGLDQLREAGCPVAGYVSRPRSADVINLLRVARCPYPTPDCGRYCPGGTADAAPACRQLAGLTDSELFRRLLTSGERSALFLSAWQISRQSYGAHQISFFYLSTGDEIARIEVPLWVAEEPALLERVHVFVADQCRRGFGYPPVLAEAHEQAIVRGPDRAAFFHLVEMTMVRRGLPYSLSQKEASKRRRAM